MPAQGFDALSGPLEAFLASNLRLEYVDHLVRTSATLGDALGPLRLAMRTHAWTGDGHRLAMARAVQAADALTREEGFHALNDWDGIADHVNVDIIPVDVLDFVHRVRGHDRPDPGTLAILVDYYAFHILSLLALRAWDTTDPDVALGRVGGLLDQLQGPHGSGQPFVSDPETLLLIATSHYEPDERGYVSLLDQVRTLSFERQRAVALGHAASMGAHLRFGFHATYARSTDAMRDDNVADYPWLHYAADVVLRAIEHHDDSAPGGPSLVVLAEALLGSLTADVASLLGAGPFRERLIARSSHLQPLFDALEPQPDTYSPLSLFFNFSHNVLKGAVVDALLRGDPWTVSFNDLLTGPSGGAGAPASRQALALALMGHAKRHPQRIRGQLMPVIVYDPDAGRAVCRATVGRLAS
ncbi:MAG: hypothetical protein NUW22_06120 [Acidobacteria bacterium]|nr:hypothetical protein [Acidobacteriota bacterium]